MDLRKGERMPLACTFLHSAESAIDVPTDSPALLSELMPLHSLTATQQHHSSDIVPASLLLYKKLSDITGHAPETDA